MEIFTTKCRGEVICETTYFEIENVVKAVWEGYADVEAVKEWGLAYLDLMKKQHCPYLLNDDRNSSGPWADSIEWFEEFLVPNLIQEGLKYYAHIVSYNIFASVSADKLESKLGKTIMRSFPTLEDGYVWLQEMQKLEKEKH